MFYTCLVCLAQIDPLEREAMVVKDMYELIEEYKVPTPPEDFAVYQVGTTPHTHLHTCLICCVASWFGGVRLTS